VLEVRGGKERMSYVVVGGVCFLVGGFMGILTMCLVAINRSEEDRQSENK